MKRYIIPFVIALSVLIQAHYADSRTVNRPNGTWWDYPTPPPHDCIVCGPDGCTWGPCPWGNH